MIYDSKNELDKKRAIEKIKYLIQNGKTFELKEKRQQRTLSQNRYLHLILGWYALEYGETIEYVKQEVFKKLVNPDIFVTEYINRKTGEYRDSLKSTADPDIDTKIMTVAIDRFRNYASKTYGIYLPEPKDMALLNEIQREIENNQQFL